MIGGEKLEALRLGRVLKFGANFQFSNAFEMPMLLHGTDEYCAWCVSRREKLCDGAKSKNHLWLDFAYAEHYNFSTSKLMF